MKNDSMTPKEKVLRRVWRMLPGIVLLLLIVLIINMGYRIKSENERIREEKLEALNKERPPVNVVVLDVNPMTIRDRLSLPAQVEPWIELTVFAEVSGRVVQVLRTEGDYVRKGDIIALLDSRDYENELASVRAELGLAEKNLDRTKSLFEEKLITGAQLDADAARFNALSASLKNAEIRLERCTITAPIDGTINGLDAKEGLYMNVQDPVAVILDIGRVKVSVGIPESDVDDVRRLSSFNITIDALDGRKVKGRKHFLSRRPETLAHLYKMELEVENSGGELLPGMFARVNIVKREVKESISVPLYSVIPRGDEQFVFVSNNDTAHVRMVETGILEGWMVEITKGLEEGDHVIVVGHRSLDEGQEVNIVRSVSYPEDLFR
jgi:membrane fusion protein (multidrug efflux system)